MKTFAKSQSAFLAECSRIEGRFHLRRIRESQSAFLAECSRISPATRSSGSEVSIRVPSGVQPHRAQEETRCKDPGVSIRVPSGVQPHPGDSWVKEGAIMLVSIRVPSGVQPHLLTNHEEEDLVSIRVPSGVQPHPCLTTTRPIELSQSAFLAECSRILPTRMVLRKCKKFILNPKGGIPVQGHRKISPLQCHIFR